jgi:NhaA family Na+:H+ antiporter
MSLFIGTLAFPDPALLDQTKLGVLAGSVLSAVAGLSVLGFGRGRPSPAGIADDVGHDTG